jgi:hypothetical protein
MGGKNEEENRRLRDLSAFSYLVSMNPHFKWEYITGVDKVNAYGISGKNERDLLMDLLIGNDINLRYYLGGRGELELFEKEKAFLKELRKQDPEATSWVLENQALIEQHLKQGTLASFPISATQVRNMVEQNISLLDSIPHQIIGHIYDHNLRAAYVLENTAKRLKKDLNGTDPMPPERAQAILDEINQGRAALFEAGVLANGKPLTLEDINKL